MIHDEIVTHEVAKLAKEKGFPQHPDENGKCGIYILYKSKNTYVLSDWTVWISAPWGSEAIAAPTQSLLQRWLREEKGIYIEVYIDWEDSIEYNIVRYSWRVTTIYRVGNHDIGGYYKNESEVYFDTYELALEDALKYALENLI